MVDHFLPVLTVDIKAIEVILPVIMICASEQVDLLIIIDALMPRPGSILLACCHHLLPSVGRELSKVCLSPHNNIFTYRLLLEELRRSVFINPLDFGLLNLRELDLINIVSLGSIKPADDIEVRILVHDRLVECPLARGIPNRDYLGPRCMLIVELIDVVEPLLLLIDAAEDEHRGIIAGCCVSISSLDRALDVLNGQPSEGIEVEDLHIA